eukprot:jgi/Hompol1/2670/HPOL_003013-RA
MGKLQLKTGTEPATLSVTESRTRTRTSTRTRTCFSTLSIVCFWLLFALSVTVHFDLLPIDSLLGKPKTPLDRAFKILEKHPLIDTHNDFPGKLQEHFKGQIANVDFSSLPQFHTDINRLRQGRVASQFWSGYIPCNLDLSLDGNNIAKTLIQMDLIKRFVAQNPDTFEMASTAADIRHIAAQGRIASLIGLEGGHQIQDSMSALRMFYDLGARYMTLTHTCHTSWADSAAQPPIHNGLTPFGFEIIAEMNRLGMMVDISHVSHKVMQDVVNATQAPLFFSHSVAFSLCQVPRNVPDDILLAMKKHDGVIMVSFWSTVIACSNNSTLSQVADHIEYIARIAGPEHVGFGGDIDGISENTIVTGLEDVSKYPFLIAELLQRGFSEKDVIGIAGGNLLRVLEKTERVAKKLAKKSFPNESPSVLKNAC